MSLDLDADPGPAGLAEAGAGLSPADGADEIDLSAPLEALPVQPFSLSDEVRFHPARSLGAAVFAGIALGLLMGRSLQTLRPSRSSA
ncbi:MAG: hypothetical protein ACKOEY_14430 [Phenylobacterium sp.]